MANKKYKTKNKDSNLTPETRLARWRKYYYDQHAFHLARNRKYYLERMFQWYEWFEEIGCGACEKCGYSGHPKALDFHHTNPEDKVFGIGKFINGRQCNKENQKIVLEELDKCECLCANCHRVYHFLLANKRHEHAKLN